MLSALSGWWHYAAFQTSPATDSLSPRIFTTAVVDGQIGFASLTITS